jgi:hypothetical protein
VVSKYIPLTLILSPRGEEIRRERARGSNLQEGQRVKPSRGPEGQKRARGSNLQNSISEDFKTNTIRV